MIVNRLQNGLIKSRIVPKASRLNCIGIQGDSYSFINILTSGRFRSQKALDNKILSHTSKIGQKLPYRFFHY
jgi:hypothetical protein